MKKLRNNNGSILQIVLIIFLVLLHFILSISMIVRSTILLYGQEKILNQRRLIEIELVYFFKKTMATDMLLSGTIRNNEESIHYTVDNMGDYYLIESQIKLKSGQYTLYLEIYVDDQRVRKLKYKA